MKRVLAASVVTLMASGCATVVKEPSQPLRIETLTMEGEIIGGAECSVTNDRGSVTMRSGESMNVRRSSKDLDITCTAPGQPTASARAVSRANGGMWGNAVVGGGIGAVIDHKKGNGYTYPTWLQLVFGKALSFDRRSEKAGAPAPATEVTQKASAAVRD